jgi:hypothetical protein
MYDCEDYLKKMEDGIAVQKPDFEVFTDHQERAIP